MNKHGQTLGDTLSVRSWDDIPAFRDFDLLRSLLDVGRILCEIVSRTGLDILDDSAQGRAGWWKRGDFGKFWLPLEQARGERLPAINKINPRPLSMWISILEWSK